MADDLRVIVALSSDQFQDGDDVPMVDWHDKDSGPYAYFGAWEDALDFVPEDNRPNTSETRWWFLFNRVPTSDAEAKAAIIARFE